MTTKQSELTEEEAVALAEWLGWELMPTMFDGGYWVTQIEFGVEVKGSCGDSYGKRNLLSKGFERDWFSSADGERALMDRLGQEQINCKIKSPIDCYEWWIISLSKYGGPFKGDVAVVEESIAPTRVLALQQAILQAIGGE